MHCPSTAPSTSTWSPSRTQWASLCPSTLSRLGYDRHRGRADGRCTTSKVPPSPVHTLGYSLTPSHHLRHRGHVDSADPVVQEKTHPGKWGASPPITARHCWFQMSKVNYTQKYDV